MIWFQTNFRCYVHPHVNSGNGMLLPLGFTYIFSPSNSSKQFHLNQVEVFVLDVDRTLPDLPGGGCVACCRKCCMGIQRLSSHPFLGWIRTRGFVFSPLILFFLGCFTLNDSFMEKMCVCWIPEKSARQNRTDLEKSCNLQSFFLNTFNG